MLNKESFDHESEFFRRNPGKFEFKQAITYDPPKPDDIATETKSQAETRT